MAEEPAPTLLDIQNASASMAAARASGAETRLGGGAATKEALETAARIQPNQSLKIERPMFVPTAPETAEERRKRRGLPPADESTRVETGRQVKSHTTFEGAELVSMLSP